MQQAGKAFAGHACGLRADHPIREACIKAACSRNIQHALIALILASCVYMLYEPVHIEPGSAAAERSNLVEWISMGTFTIELFVKVVAHGLTSHEGAYLHDPWNWLDLAVIVPFWLLIAFADLPSLRALQLARALRPLRTLRQFPSVRRVVVAFFHALPSLSSVVAFTAFFVLVKRPNCMFEPHR